MSIVTFPKQTLPLSRKTVKWRKQCVDWAKDKTIFGSELIRSSVRHKQINNDLVNGKLHMEDLQLILNPERLAKEFVPDNIQHYPIINSKINLLLGEELARVFDYRVVITNPTAVTEIENTKKNEVMAKLTQLVQDTSLSQEEFEEKSAKLAEYATFEYQDFREIRANAFLNHYSKELNFPNIFNAGFKDALTNGEEAYQVDIEGGEPVLKKLNNIKIRAYRSGYSNRLEDCDIITIEDYWSPGKIYDTFYDSLSPKDVKYIESLPSTMKEGVIDSMSNIDERAGFVRKDFIDDAHFNGDELFSWSSPANSSLMPYDFAGNVRVLQVYWKSKRKVKKVKQYDPVTGDVIFNLYDESYIPNENLGEEETSLWINQAWEGTLIGDEVYVNMRPRPIQYNRLSNPSRCHFGIIGTVYNFNDDKPYSLVDMMKPYNYLYDIIHDRLNSLIASNFGKLVRLDLAKVPKGWQVDKWLYYARVNKIIVEDSFKEGNVGLAKGVIAGGLNNASSGVVDAELGNSIQFYINLLEFIKVEMSEITGISKQREGEIANRETVGGVERSTLQSSHITEWLFSTHEDTKKRVLTAFLETAKISQRGKSNKFEYILPNGSKILITIDGDEFSEEDHGIVVDSSNNSQKFAQVLESLAQAALQNQALDFSTIMRLYSTSSLTEKQRLVETSERNMMERQQQAQQQEMQMQQQQIQANQQQYQADLEFKDRINMRDNDTKIVVANIQAQSKIATANPSIEDGINEPMSESEREKLKESIRQFNAKHQLDKDRLAFEKDKAKTDAALKEKQIRVRNNGTAKK